MDRNTFLSKAKLKTTDIDIPDLGIIKIRELSAAQVNDYAKETKAGAEEIELLVSLVIGSIVDDTHTPLFNNADREHIRNMPLSVLKAVAENAAKLAGILDDAQAKKK